MAGTLWKEKDPACMVALLQQEESHSLTGASPDAPTLLTVPIQSPLNTVSDVKPTASVCQHGSKAVLSRRSAQRLVLACLLHYSGCIIL